jgi:hypothetical protein
MIALKRKRRVGNVSRESKSASTVSKIRSTESLSEKQIETEILFRLNQIKDCYAWKNHTTGIFDPRRGVFRKLGGYAIKGVSDIIGIYKGKMLCLEVKSATGKLRPEQQKFLERMKDLGAITGVVRSWPEAQRALDEIAGDTQHTPAETYSTEF